MRALIATMLLLAANVANAQSWVSEIVSPPGSPGSCMSLRLLFDMDLAGDTLTVKPPNVQALSGAVAADGSVRVSFVSAMGGGAITITGNARTRDLKLTVEKLPGCLYTLSPVASGAGVKTVTLRACDRSILYALEPPADSTLPILKAFSGVWIGVRDIQCAGAVFERVSDPNSVQVVWFNGPYPAAHASGGSMVAQTIRGIGKFDGTKVTMDMRGTIFEFIPVDSRTMTIITHFQTRSVGTLKKQ